jgi:hypothetical protein
MFIPAPPLCLIGSAFVDVQLHQYNSRYAGCDVQLPHRSVIHYNVTFSFKEGVAHEPGLQRVAVFLSDLRTRALIHNFDIRPNENGLHFVEIQFLNREQFDRPFKEVATIGIHAGAHGFMIENVAQFSVAIVEDE